MKKIGNILFLYFFVFVMCMGASFAYFVWKGDDVSVNVNFADLDPYIKYSSTKVEGSTITPSTDYKDGASNDITFNKESNGDNLNVYGHVYLKVTSADNDNLFKASNLKWTLVSVNNNTETKIATGNFVGESVVSDNDTSKMIPANINFPLTKDTENTTYKVYVWVDSDAPMNKDISNNNISVDTYVEANTYDDNTGKLNELHIREVDYQVGKITKIVGYSSIYNITHYMITSSTTNPTSSDTNWISISSPSTLVTITPNYSMNDNNNICIKNTNNDIYCKSIGKYTDEIDRPTNTLCKSNLIYNGNSQQLVSSINNTGYTLSNNYNQYNAGSYDITATLKDNYSWKDGTSTDTTITCSIAKKDLTITAKDQTIDYGKNIDTTTSSISTTDLATNQSISNITLTPSTSNATTSGTITPSNATIIDNESNKVTDNYNITYINGKLTINKVSSTCPTIEGYSGIYDGNDHTITVIGGSGGTIKYRTSTSDSWSTTKPTRRNAGTTTVYVEVEGDSNHNTIDCGNKNINITQADTSISLSAKESTYTGSAISSNTATVSPNSGGTVTYTYYTDSSCSTVTPTSTGASSAGAAPIDVGNYYVKATVTSTTNYKGATSSCVKHTINAKELTISWSNTSFNYDGNDHIPSASASTGVSGETINLSVSGSQKNAGTYNATASCSSVSGNRAKCSNYSLKSTTTSFSINKINPTLTVSTTSLSLTYGTNQTFTYTYNGDGEVKCVSSNTSYATCSISGNTVTVVPKSVTSSAVTIGLYTTEGTNYKALGSSSSPNKTVSTTVKGITYTATFNKGSGVSSVGSSSLSCTTTGSNTSCTVTAPSITSSTGYNTGKWGTSSSTQGSIEAGSSITLSSNATYYAIALPNTYTITYDLNDINKMIYWNYQYQDRFTINSYDKSSKMTDFSVYGEGGWEIVYIPITTVSGAEYTISFDYQILTSYSSGYSGLGYQVYGSIPSDSNNLSSALYTGYLPTSAQTSTSTVTFSFTATGTTTYFGFNFGMCADYATTRVKIGNIKLKSNYTYSDSLNIELPSLTPTGYSFSGWSSDSKTKTLVNDNNEYSSYSSDWSEIKQYTITAPFSSGETYRVEVDAKGSGTLYSYFYGDSNYLQVAQVTNSDGYNNTNSDGSNEISLNSEYKHYSIIFTLGSNGNGNVNKYLLFRTMSGSLATINNIKFYKLNSNENIYVNNVSLKSLVNSNLFNFSATGMINSYTLTINPNGGTYNSSTSNSTVTQEYDSLYGLNSVSKTNYNFTSWSLSGSGQLIRGDASGGASSTGIFTQTSKVDSDGSPYTKYTINYTNTNSSGTYVWPKISFSNYAYTSGHTYRLSYMLRVNSRSGFRYLHIRHGAFNNDWGSNLMKANEINQDNGTDWVYYSIDNTFTGTTATLNGSTYNIDPWIQIYSAINGGDTGIADFDIKNLTIYDVTAGTYISNGVYDGYIYKYGAGNGTATANYQIKTSTLSITKNTGVDTIYYKINGASSWSSTTSSTSATINHGTTVQYYYTASTGYTADTTCTSDSPCVLSSNVSGDLTLSPTSTINNYYLDLNGYLDGSVDGGIGGYGTADVYVNGSLVCDDCTDYCTQHPYGSSYEIKDIKSTTGHTYNGVYSGSLSGTITGGIGVYLNFTTNTYTLNVSKGTGVSTIYYKVNGASSYSSTSSSLSTTVTYGTSYSYYGVPSTGYSMSTCTSSSPCTGTVGTSNISGSVSASINYYTLTLTKGSGVSTIYYKTSSSSSYTSSTSTVQISVPYGTTYNYYGVSNTGYSMSGCSSSSVCSVTMGTSSVSKSLSATVNQYTLSISKGTGVGTIYYKINGASSYSSTSSNASLSVNYGTTYYYYGSPSSGYYMTSCTSSSPCSGTMTTSGASVSLVAYEAVYQLYNSSGTSTGYATGLSSAISNVSSGGTVKALKSNTSSAVTVSKNVTINTNGYTITMTGTLTNSSGYTLSITGNGKMYSTASLEQFILTNGTTNLTSATIYCTSCSNAVWVYGTFNMYSGTVRGGNGNGFMVRAATLNIYSGTIVGDTASGIKFSGGNLTLTTSASNISVSGLLYGILAGSDYAKSDIHISGNTGEGPYIEIFTTSTSNISATALCINPSSSYSYSSTVEIGGAALYSYGNGVSNGVSSTMTITKNVIIESKNYTLLNKNILYLGYNPTSSTLDSSIDDYVTIANANYTYPIYNYENATIYMGGGTYVYDTRDTSSYTSDNTKKPIANYGTINLNGGRIYYSYGVASAFYNLGSGKVNASGWGYYTGTYTYKFQYYTAGTSYTIKRYSYKKS